MFLTTVPYFALDLTSSSMTSHEPTNLPSFTTTEQTEPRDPVDDGLTAAVASWLMSRRAQLAMRALQHGLPLTVSTQVPVAEFIEGGMQTTMEVRQQSLFEALGSVVHPMV